MKSVTVRTYEGNHTISNVDSVHWNSSERVLSVYRITNGKSETVAQFVNWDSYVIEDDENGEGTS